MLYRGHTSLAHYTYFACLLRPFTCCISISAAVADPHEATATESGQWVEARHHICQTELAVSLENLPTPVACSDKNVEEDALPSTGLCSASRENSTDDRKSSPSFRTASISFSGSRQSSTEPQ